MRKLVEAEQPIFEGLVDFNGSLIPIFVDNPDGIDSVSLHHYLASMV